MTKKQRRSSRALMASRNSFRFTPTTAALHRQGMQEALWVNAMVKQINAQARAREMAARQKKAAAQTP